MTKELTLPPPGDAPFGQCLAGVLNADHAELALLLVSTDTAREFGTAQVGLVAPYHAYMRQNCHFYTREAIASILSHNMAPLSTTVFSVLHVLRAGVQLQQEYRFLSSTGET